MKKLCYLLSAELLLSTAGKEIRAQQRIIEDNADFSLRIQLHKLEADEKKDKYLMEISLANKRNYDLYYAVAKNSNVSYMNTSMGTIKVQNATGLMKSNCLGHLISPGFNTFARKRPCKSGAIKIRPRC